jgi:predicted negative regulator of RcsB-dependent stress response
MKSKERHDIKEDQIMEVFKSGIDFIKEHKKISVYAGATLILILFIIIGVQTYNAIRIKKENKVLNKIMTLLKNNNLSDKNYTEILNLSKKGKLPVYGLLILSENYLKKGEYDKAEKIIKNISKGNGDFNYKKSQLIKIQIDYAKKNYNELLNLYRGKIQNELKDKTEFPEDIILYYVAKSYEAKKEFDSARKIWTQLKEKYPYSIFGKIANNQLMALQ